MSPIKEESTYREKLKIDLIKQSVHLENEKQRDKKKIEIRIRLYLCNNIHTSIITIPSNYVSTRNKDM